jgi:hypothetical protein
MAVQADQAFRSFDLLLSSRPLSLARFRIDLHWLKHRKDFAGPIVGCGEDLLAVGRKGHDDNGRRVPAAAGNGVH